LCLVYMKPVSWAKGRNPKSEFLPKNEQPTRGGCLGPILWALEWATSSHMLPYKKSKDPPQDHEKLPQ
jgi:hypothetical protein